MTDNTMLELTERFKECSREILRLEGEQSEILERAASHVNYRLNEELPAAGCNLVFLPEYGTYAPADSDWHAKRAISDLAQAVVNFNFAMMNEDEGFLSGWNPSVGMRGQWQPGVAWQESVGDACWDYYVFSGGEFGDQIYIPCWLVDWDAEDVARIVNTRAKQAEFE